MARARSARVGILLIALFLGLALAELCLRFFFPNLRRDERNLLYRYDARLGWFPIPNSRRVLANSRTVTAIHNRDGFRGPDYTDSKKPVLLFLGDSFVWGLDVEAAERFTDKLQTKHPEWAIYNFGVSGYGTDQEYLLLDQFFDKYKPQVVFLVFCSENDDSDNCWNCRWGYYKPYFTVSGTRLELKGIPVPKGAPVFYADHPLVCRLYLARLLVSSWYKLFGPPRFHNPNPTGPLLRDLQKYVQAKGAAFAVGVTRSYGPLEDFLRAFRIPFVDLSTDLRYPGSGNHWTPEGHSFVCQKIDEFLGTYGKTEAPTP